MGINQIPGQGQLPFLDCAEIDPASEWCQRWSGRQHSWRHRSEGGFDPALYSVEAVDENTARSYVCRNHYSGTYPAASRRYGLFHHGEDRALVGVAVFGIPMSAKVLTNVFPGLEPMVQSLELSRFVLEGARGGTAGRAPGNSETWFLARCFSELAAGGVGGVVAFADPVPRRIAGEIIFPGHVGAVYQAGNAVALGRSTARTLTLLPDGSVLSDRSAQKIRAQERGHDHVERRLIALGARAAHAGEKPAGWMVGALEEVGATRLRHRGNYRYAFRTRGGKAGRRIEITGVASTYPKLVDVA